MPEVILTITAQNNASAVISQASAALASLDAEAQKAMQSQLGLEAAANRLILASNSYVEAKSRETAATTAASRAAQDQIEAMTRVAAALQLAQSGALSLVQAQTLLTGTSGQYVAAQEGVVGANNRVTDSINARIAAEARLDSAQVTYTNRNAAVYPPSRAANAAGYVPPGPVWETGVVTPYMDASGTVTTQALRAQVQAEAAASAAAVAAQDAAAQEQVDSINKGVAFVAAARQAAAQQAAADIARQAAANVEAIQKAAALIAAANASMGGTPEQAASYTTLRGQAAGAQLGAAQASLRAEALIDQTNRVVPEEPASTAGERSNLANVAQNFLVYGLGYQAAYLAESQFSQSVGRSAAFSRQMGSLQAQTSGTGPGGTMTSDEAAQLTGLTTAYAGGGKTPYNAQALGAGEYSLASLGVGINTGANYPRSVFAITQIAAKMSAAANAPDLSQATDTLTSVIADYGLNNANVVANTKRVADQLQVGVRIGKADMPSFAAQVGIPAAEAGRMGVSSADVISYLAAESAGGLPSGEMGQDLFALLRSAEAPTMKQQAVGHSLGIDYNANYWAKNGLVGGLEMIQSRMQAQGLNRPEQATVLDRLFGNEAASKGLGAAFAGGLYGTASQVNASGGAVDAAYGTSQMAAGAQLADAETKLATAFDSLTTQTLPLLTGAIDTLIGSIKVVQDPGQSVIGMLDTLKETILHPGSDTTAANTAALRDLYVRSSTTPHAAGDKLNSQGFWGTVDAGGNFSIDPNQGVPRAAAASAHVPTGPGSFMGLVTGGGGPTSGGGAGPVIVPGAASGYAYTGKMGDQSDAYLTARVPGRGANAVLPDVSDALDAIKTAINGNAGYSAVESALGVYKRVVNSQPDGLIRPEQRAYDISNATQMTNTYVRGMLAGPGDQWNVTAAQMNLDAAQQMLAAPDKLKQVYQTYLDAETKLILDSTAKGSDVQSRQLGQVAKAAEVFNYNTDKAAADRTMKDYDNQIALAKLQNNFPALQKAEGDKVAYARGAASLLKLDPSDLALLAAQAQSDMLTLKPLVDNAPFLQRNPGIGGLEAGINSTAVRLGGGMDPTAREIQYLKQQLQAANTEITTLLTQIAANTAAGRGSTAPVPLAMTGQRSSRAG